MDGQRVRNHAVLAQAAMEILEVLCKHGIKHGEIETVFTYVREKASEQPVSIDSHGSR
ncbi:hypothetical protein [Alicyclobacillus macrosporangiidus]|uniref:Uncharacterized protein n=1 Tax=Alicyclobacillus macrosporangiidus TaxID=392015 RepID=A0A1I7IB83_9BACL|nr:hypothetical protein [Alicyclobacillus macrosporangiidus]SFU70106.1 hypothetical protein SAMN05421543_106107 [Alicyclobacillus macrosporangiidus]